MKPPNEIIERCDGKCPNCGKKLSYTLKNFEVRSVVETNQLSSLETEKRRPSKTKSRSKTKKRLIKRAPIRLMP